jgi:hypothetical protein
MMTPTTTAMTATVEAASSMERFYPDREIPTRKLLRAVVARLLGRKG